MLRDLLKPNSFMANLLYSSNLERPSKVPQVSLEGYSMGVRMPHIWESKCPQGLYQDSKTGDRLAKEARNSSDNLFGRFFTDSQTTFLLGTGEQFYRALLN